jgi:hypothetical protein
MGGENFTIFVKPGAWRASGSSCSEKSESADGYCSVAGRYSQVVWLIVWGAMAGCR